jgi:hypothetical protein
MRAPAEKRNSVEDQQDLDQSRRISGQGMERPLQKTPRTRKINQYRAVSTPQVCMFMQSLMEY